MGFYLSKPKIDKESVDESGKYVRCGASSMQGWRDSQEDAHNCIIDYDENLSFFAVYDGHGGHEVAEYCSLKLPAFLKNCESYKMKEYSKALKEAFLGFDATLIKPEVVSILKQIARERLLREEALENCSTDHKSLDEYKNRIGISNISDRDNTGEVSDKKETNSNIITVNTEEIVNTKNDDNASCESNNKVTGNGSPESIKEENEDEKDCSGKQQGFVNGCTAVVALLNGRDLYVANAGDSRCVVCHNGKALDMTLDHKPENHVELKRILDAGGEVSCGRVQGDLNLSRAMGDHRYKRTPELPPEQQMVTVLPDIRTLTLDAKQDEFMILACDGVWNKMTSQEVIDFVRTRMEDKDKKLSTICEELFDHCLADDTNDEDGCDNMTAVLVQFLPCLADIISSNL